MHKLFRARTDYTWTWKESCALVLYALLVGWATAHHEPWGDEAQAWLIARDLPLSRIFLHQLHHEGTPGLWHLLLRFEAWCHLSYAGMHWVTAAIGVATAWLLLRYSPFPSLIRFTLPFIAAFAYQGPIVARSYILTIFLVLSLATVMRSPRFRPWMFVLLAGLLASTSVHGMLMAFAFAVLYLTPFLWRQVQPTVAFPVPVGAVLCLCLFFGFAFYTALPSPETSSATHQVGSKLASHHALAKVLAKLTTSNVPTAVAPPHEATYTKPDGLTGWRLKLWNTTHNVEHGSAPVKALGKLVGLASFLIYTISASTLLGLVFYITLTLWTVATRNIVQSLPLLFFLLAGYKLGMSEHHLLLSWGILVATLWLAWPKEETARRHSRLHSIFCTVLLLVLAENVAFTAYAIAYDTQKPFDGAQNAAAFLAQLPPSQVAGFNFHSITVQPYFPRNIFYNQPSAFWPWSVVENPDDSVETTLAQHPRYVVVGAGYFGTATMMNQIVPNNAPNTRDDPDDVIERIQHAGYRETHRFCGAQPMHFGTASQICELVFEP